jgi:hypothetical protein
LIVKVELLYFDDCPSYAELMPRLRELLAREGIEEEVGLRRVETPRTDDGLARTPPEEWIRAALARVG